VDKADGHRTLTDGRRDAVHRPRTDVPRRKDARAAGLQQIGLPVLLPDLSELLVLPEVAARLEKAFLIFDNMQPDPVRERLGADKDEPAIGYMDILFVLI